MPENWVAGIDIYQYIRKILLSQLSAPEQRDSNFHSQAAQLPLSASADANVQGEEYLAVQPMWQSGDWPNQATQACGGYNQ
jgi:hypothetical protein